MKERDGIDEEMKEGFLAAEGGKFLWEQKGKFEVIMTLGCWKSGFSLVANSCG